MDIAKSMFFGDATSANRVRTDKQPTKPSSRESAIYFLKLVAFATLWIVATLLGLAVAVPAILLKTPAHWAFRWYMRLIQRAYAGILPITALIFLPNSQLVLSGDWKEMDPKAKTIVIANHQAYPDWVYLWLVAWARNCHGEFRVMLIKILAMIPLLGQGMHLFEFVFLNQKLDKDKEIIEKSLQTARKDVKLPLWMLIFPEGTLNTPENVAKSRKYAEKVNMSYHPQHCILPRSMGVFLTIQNLIPECNDIFDLTVGYSGVTATEVPFQKLLPDKVFLQNMHPRQVHVHMQRFHVSDVPGFRATEIETNDNEARRSALDRWLGGVWRKKDDRLNQFYSTGSMTTESDNGAVLVVNLVPSAEDMLYFFGLLLAGYIVMPMYWRAPYWIVTSGVRLMKSAGLEVSWIF